MSIVVLIEGGGPGYRYIKSLDRGCFDASDKR